MSLQHLAIVFGFPLFAVALIFLIGFEVMRNRNKAERNLNQDDEHLGI